MSMHELKGVNKGTKDKKYEPISVQRALPSISPALTPENNYHVLFLH